MRPTDIPTSDLELARLTAREMVLRYLALAASDPTSKRFGKLYELGFSQLARSAGRFLAEDPAARPPKLAPGEAPPAELDLGPLIAALDAPRGRLRSDHTRVFGLVVSKHCPPYEVQYCPQTFSIYRSQRMADVAGYYRAFGVEPGRDVPERADHIACELEFLAWAVAKERHARSQAAQPADADGVGTAWEERAAVCREAQRDFVAEHLAWWVPAFAHALDARARALDPPAPHCVALARALATVIPIERALLGVGPPDELAQPRSDEEPAVDACGGCEAAT